MGACQDSSGANSPRKNRARPSLGLGDSDYYRPTSNPRENLGLEKREEHRSGQRRPSASCFRPAANLFPRETEKRSWRRHRGKSYLTRIASDSQPIALGARGGPAQVEQRYYAGFHRFRFSFSFSGFFPQLSSWTSRCVSLVHAHNTMLCRYAALTSHLPHHHQTNTMRAH